MSGFDLVGNVVLGSKKVIRNKKNFVSHLCSSQCSRWNYDARRWKKTYVEESQSRKTAPSPETTSLKSFGEGSLAVVEAISFLGKAAVYNVRKIKTFLRFSFYIVCSS